MKFDINDPKLTFMGRIDHDPDGAFFYYAGSQLILQFKGTTLSAVIENFKIYGYSFLGVVLDGQEYKLDLNFEGEKTIEIAGGLKDTAHTIILYKCQGGSHYFKIKQLNSDGELLSAKPLPDFKMECYGDSITCGSACEMLDYLGKADPDEETSGYDNAWYSYAMITSRLLNAQIHFVAQGGIAIFDHTGYFHQPEYIGMETVFDKSCYFPEYPSYRQWDFKKYTPDLVTFCIGQNDLHTETGINNDINKEPFRTEWKEKYKEIITRLMQEYPNAQFVLFMSVLNHNRGWDTAVEEIAGELASERVHYFEFKRCGKATAGHPRIPEQEEMACELTQYIRQIFPNRKF